MTRSATRSTNALAIATLVLVQLALSSCSITTFVSGCPPVAPSELPSGALPGDAVEDVAGGTKQFIWGTGRDMVDLRVGLTYRAKGLDTVLANVTVRGQPAVVFQFEPDPQTGIGLEWSESGCDYNVFLAPEITAEELVEFAGRY